MGKILKISILLIVNSFVLASSAFALERHIELMLEIDRETGKHVYCDDRYLESDPASYQVCLDAMDKVRDLILNLRQRKEKIEQLDYFSEVFITRFKAASDIRPDVNIDGDLNLFPEMTSEEMTNKILALNNDNRIMRDLLAQINGVLKSHARDGHFSSMIVTCDEDEETLVDEGKRFLKYIPIPSKVKMDFNKCLFALDQFRDLLAADSEFASWIYNESRLDYIVLGLSGPRRYGSRTSSIQINSYYAGPEKIKGQIREMAARVR